LASIGDPAAVPALAKRLDDPSLEVRGSACEALTGIGDPAAIPVLMARIDKDWDVHDVVRKALDGLIEDLDARHKALLPVLHGMLCAACLSGFGETAQRLGPFRSVRWFSCPTCGRMAAIGARGVLTGVKRVVAAIDQTMTEPFVIEDETVTVNWLARRSFSDFDSVEIIGADEIDVEKFYVQLRNDADAERRQRYRTMQCRVRRALELRHNTIHNLEAVFGEVVRV
jgi:hypothetical protein